MNYTKIVNLTKQKTIIDRAEVAETFFSRAKGLLGRKKFIPGEALVITQCSGIHMFFMRFPIDAVFVGIDRRVIRIIKGLKPWQVVPVVWGSSYVIELPAGFATEEVVNTGDIIELVALI